MRWPSATSARSSPRATHAKPATAGGESCAPTSAPTVNRPAPGGDETRIPRPADCGRPIACDFVIEIAYRSCFRSKMRSLRTLEWGPRQGPRVPPNEMGPKPVASSAGSTKRPRPGQCRRRLRGRSRLSVCDPVSAENDHPGKHDRAITTGRIQTHVGPDLTLSNNAMCHHPRRLIATTRKAQANSAGSTPSPTHTWSTPLIVQVAKKTARQPTYRRTPIPTDGRRVERLTSGNHS